MKTTTKRRVRRIRKKVGRAVVQGADLAMQAAAEVSLAGPNLSLPPNRRQLLSLALEGARKIRQRPMLLANRAVSLVSNLARRDGTEGAPPFGGDRRFADPEWSSHAWSRALARGYLALSREAMQLVDDLEFEGAKARRARFMMSLLVDALSPGNSPLTNPVALKRARETHGRSLRDGLRHLIHDLRHNGGLPTMVDPTPFKIGENIACTPGDVVLRTEMFELIQYRPSTAEVHARPLLIVPPQINKFYFLDLSPHNSMVRYAVAQGFQVFMLSWRNPEPEHADWGLEEYVGAIEQADKAAREITGSADANWLGLCAGGITASIAAAQFAARGLPSPHCLSLGVTLLDLSQIDHTNMGAFFSPANMKVATEKAQRKGYLDGRQLSRTFAWVRANDLVWNYVVNNYCLGNSPPAFDILFWNSDATRLPARLLTDFVSILEHQTLNRANLLSIDGVPIDLKNVRCDSFIIGGQTDHLTPWQGCYRSTQMLGGKSKFVLFTSGHIQTLTSITPSKKTVCRVADGNPPDAEAWLSKSQPQQTVVWELWAQWLQARAGDKLPAPDSTGSAQYPPIEPAPGQYVFG
ncbi:MAG: alpha/beta fold hydrolase [Nevskia sp.]|nr:alpha/beta fold hydrolase [Nevskia sp.]